MCTFYVARPDEPLRPAYPAPAGQRAAPPARTITLGRPLRLTFVLLSVAAATSASAQGFEPAFPAPASPEVHSGMFRA